MGILGTNVYIYCNNDPVNFFDPTGYSPWSAIGQALGQLIDTPEFLAILDVRLWAQRNGIYDDEQFANTLQLEIHESSTTPNADFIYGTASFMYGNTRYEIEFISGTSQGLSNYAAARMRNEVIPSRRAEGRRSLGRIILGAIPFSWVPGLMVTVGEIQDDQRSWGAHIFDIAHPNAISGRGHIRMIIPMYVRENGILRYPYWNRNPSWAWF